MHWEGVGVWFWSSEMTKSGNVRTIELSVLRSPDVAIFRVETVGAGDTKPSLDLGHRMVINPPSTIADRDPSANPGDLNFPIVSELAEDALLVPDVDVRELPGHEARRRTQRRRTGSQLYSQALPRQSSATSASSSPAETSTPPYFRNSGPPNPRSRISLTLRPYIPYTGAP
jgi:hypothetical protein